MQSAAPHVPTIPVPIAEVIGVAKEYVEASRFDAADRMLNHVLAGEPGHGEALHLSGFVAFKKNRLEQAADKMERALAAGANAPRQLCNLAEVYRVLGRLEEGLVAIRRAGALAPSDPVCHFNEAMLYYEKLETEACIKASRRAIQLKPDMPEAHMRLGQALLLTGAFAEGWQEYEWRYQISGAQPLMPAALAARTDRPQWDGSRLPPGRRLLLIADQGFGDVLMFARYLPWVMSRCAEVVVAVSGELHDLLRRQFPGPEYQMRWDQVGEYTAFCPFSGLPRLAGTTTESIPQTTPYVTADAGAVSRWEDWLARSAPPGHRRVGLAWAGRPTHNNDRNRSMTLASLAPLAAVPGVAFVSLQKGPAASQLRTWQGPAPIVDAESGLHSFEDTAGLLKVLDLVIAVDTSINHLAGAMARPAWVMMPFAPDWRWLTERTDSPWYPSLRLYRQPAPRAWEPVVQQIATDLAAWAAAPA